MDTRVVTLGAVVVIAAVALLAMLLRTRNAGAGELEFTPNPANDTVVICKGRSEAELTKIFADFTRVYAARLAISEPFRVERRGDILRISFPGDIQPTLLSFLVNYPRYPKDMDLANREVAVLGLVTLTAAFPLPRNDYVGKKARLYVPSDDRDYDLVYVAVDWEDFRQSFTNMA